MAFTYDYARPALTVDCVVFGFDGGGLQVLLIRRALEPFAGSWAFPGGFVEMDEDLDVAARRELEEETGLRDVFLEQLYTFGAPARDPRGRVVSVAYYALVRPDQHPAAGGSDASEAGWHAVDELPGLAFDHAEVLRVALERLRGKIRYQPVGFELLPKRFTLGQLQGLYEAILGRGIDKRNFRRKVAAFDFLVPLEEFVRGRHRPARLYRFDRRKYRALEKRGFLFEL
ncbi:MAG: NUDIX hydrolase [Verrucomicrobiota bacterium JB025]|nr:NUDIX domain-containing protein [Verrucomicrobiota bacterium JB025]